MSKIVSIATGVPSYQHQQQAISTFADAVYSENADDTRKIKFLYRHSGINTRYSVLPDYSCPEADRSFYEKNTTLEPFPGLEKRMACYAEHAAGLSVNTIRKCIAGKISSDDITHLVTVSCTGMSAPGLDLEIMEMMNLRPTLARTSINFMGCYAAIHALKIADAICNNDVSANVMIVCTELCTLHFQKDNSVDNITATLLFADGCAAMLVQHGNSAYKGFSIRKFYAEVAFRGKQDMSWQLSSNGFLMSLSGYVPNLVKEDFNTLVERALHDAGIGKNDITHWCIHPGGTKILEAIQNSAGLTKEQLHYAYDVLANYGNMSSPTVIFVLEKIMQELEADNNNSSGIVFAAAFGPGLTMETFIAAYE